MVRKHASEVNLANNEHFTPLMVAAMHNCREVALVLLHEGARVDLKDAESGWTAMHHALYRGHVSLAQLLFHHTCEPLPAILELVEGQIITLPGFTCLEFSALEQGENRVAVLASHRAAGVSKWEMSRANYMRGEQTLDALDNEDNSPVDLFSLW